MFNKIRTHYNNRQAELTALDRIARLEIDATRQDRRQTTDEIEALKHEELTKRMPDTLVLTREDAQAIGAQAVRQATGEMAVVRAHERETVSR